VLGGHIIDFFVWGFITSFGMFQAYYTSNSLSSPSKISWIGSMPIFLLMTIPLWSGAASDLRHYKLVLRMALVLLPLAERLLKKRLPPKISAKSFEPSELKDVVFVLFVSLHECPTREGLLTNKDFRLFSQLQRTLLCFLLCSSYPILEVYLVLALDKSTDIHAASST
jgi:hypothetical protein